MESGKSSGQNKRDTVVGLPRHDEEYAAFGRTGLAG